MLRADLGPLHGSILRGDDQLSTREDDVVATCKNEVPENLVVRVSAHKIDGTATRWRKTPSTVLSDPEEANCPTPHEGNPCADCWDCWSADVRNLPSFKP